MNLKQAIKEKVNGKKYPTLKRIKVGRVISVIATLPLFTSWMFLISIPMMIPISPSIWAKDKIRYLKQSWSLR